MSQLQTNMSGVNPEPLWGVSSPDVYLEDSAPALFGCTGEDEHGVGGFLILDLVNLDFHHLANTLLTAQAFGCQSCASRFSLTRMLFQCLALRTDGTVNATTTATTTLMIGVGGDREGDLNFT